MIGSLVVFAVAVLFKTPPEIIEAAGRKAEEADRGESKPLAMRPQGA